MCAGDLRSALSSTAGGGNKTIRPRSPTVPMAGNKRKLDALAYDRQLEAEAERRRLVRVCVPLATELQPCGLPHRPRAAGPWG